MDYIIVNKAKIDKLNLTDKNKRLSPVKIISGELVLCSDILTDEETWGHAFTYLKTCKQIEITINDFPKPEMI